MSIQLKLAAVIVAVLALGATQASACMETDASADNQSVVVADAGSQTGADHAPTTENQAPPAQ